jgi:hypothetical protein
MYEQLHEDVQTLQENTEGFKAHKEATTAELRHLFQGIIDKNSNLLLEVGTSATTQPQYAPNTDVDHDPVDVTPTPTPTPTPTQDTYAQRDLSEDDLEIDTSRLRPKVIQLLDCLRRGYHIASLQLPPQHPTSSLFRESVDFMDELISASARFTNGEFFDLIHDKLTRAYRRTAAMKLVAKQLADSRPETLQSLQQFVDAHEAAIECLSNDYSDNSMQRVMPHQQSQTYFEEWEAPFHFIQQATRDRTYMLSLTRAAMAEQLSVNLLAMARTSQQQQPWV